MQRNKEYASHVEEAKQFLDNLRHLQHFGRRAETDVPHSPRERFLLKYSRLFSGPEYERRAALSWWGVGEERVGVPSTV